MDISALDGFISCSGREGEVWEDISVARSEEVQQLQHVRDPIHHHLPGREQYDEDLKE